MRVVLVCVFLFWKVTSPSVVNAQEITTAVGTDTQGTLPGGAVLENTAAQSETGVVAGPTAQRPATRQIRQTNYPLSGTFAWLAAGAAGIVIPLLLFALPALTLAWFGPFAPLGFLLALVVATATTAAGGAVVWAVSSAFSNIKSGFLMPVLSSAGIGLASTFVGGVLATAVIVTGFAVAWFVGPFPDLRVRPDSQRDWRNLWTGSVPLVLGTSALAFFVWGTGVLVAAIAGPMVAAYVYHGNGVEKTE